MAAAGERVMDAWKARKYIMMIWIEDYDLPVKMNQSQGVSQASRLAQNTENTLPSDGV